MKKLNYLKNIFSECCGKQNFHPQRVFKMMLLFVFICGFGNRSLALSLDQQDPITITGAVTDKNGMPMPGVTVLVKNTHKGTQTNFDGNYSLKVKSSQSVLLFSYVGMKTISRQVGTNTSLNIKMESDIGSLDEVVLVGYGSQRKGDLTGAISRVSAEDLEERPSVSIIQSLQGAVPGLNIGQTNTAGGEPGISIRGRTSISGSQSPLIVLDGAIFRGSLSDINPNDVKSIDVLKDASSTAVYGSQAANGVIIISSKTGGENNELVVNYSTYYSILEPTKKFLPESPEAFIDRVTGGYFMDSRTEESGYLEPNPNFDVSSIFRSNDQSRAYEEGILTNWYDIVTNNSIEALNHNLSISKRNDDGKYFLSAGYTSKGGYMVNEDYERFNARINIDNDLTDWLKVGIQSFLTSSDYSGEGLDPDSRYQYSWYAPIYDEDGVTLLQNPRGVGAIYNPFLVMQSDDLNKRLDLFGNVYADLTIPFIDGLSFRVNYNINSTRESRYYYRSYQNNFQGEGLKREKIGKDWTNDFILTYDKVFAEKHKVTATVAYGREKRTFNSTQAQAKGFNNHALGYNSLQSGDAEQQSVTTNAFQETSLYNLNRLFYGYDNKYLLTLTVRTDGFSGFGQDYKYGTFPSASAAWVLSQENFFKNNLKFVNNLKLRGSYGANGNRTIGRYSTLARLDSGYGYVNGDKEPVYIQGISTLANPNLKWETTIGLNIGLDYSLFNSRISGSVDYYNTNTEDLLYNVDIPGITSFGKISDNLGKLHNDGLEIALSTRNIQTKNFIWSTDINFSRNRNELRELLGYDNNGDGVEDDLLSEKLFIGESLGAIYDYQTNGELWQLDDDIPNTADVGSYKITDTNGDGEITPDDRVIIGNNLPAYRWSMNNRFKYKNWSLSVFINSIQGNSNYYINKDRLIGSGFNSLGHLSWDNENFPAGLDFWLPENPDARYQRLGVEVPNGLDGSRYVDRSFVRLQSVNLAYSFNKKTLKKLMNIDGVKIFLNGKNLHTWTNWPGWDPETGEGITSNGRPVLTHYTVGLDVTF